MKNPHTQYRVLDGFEDVSVTPDIWNALLQGGPVDEIFLTWQWQKAWWETFGRGKLLLCVAEVQGNPVAIAPLFSDEGMIFFVGSGGSDYLDFLGDITFPEVLENLLLLAIGQTPDFCGFRFYHVSDHSSTGSLLPMVAQHQNWQFYEEGFLPSPLLDIKNLPEQAEQATMKKSLVRHENWFNKQGEIKVRHFHKSADILPRMDQFFDQHIARWEQTPYPSLFNADIQKTFYKRLCEMIAVKGWLRFTMITWKNNPIAYHFGFLYQKKFLWYKPSFDISLARHSPGEVLIRQLLIQSIKEKAVIFDFGLGDEAFKKRFASDTPVVKTWGIYPFS